MDVDKLKPFAKAVAAAAAALGVIAASLSDGKVDGDELVAILSAVGGVYAVWRVRNTKTGSVL